MDIVNYIILWPKAYYYSGTRWPCAKSEDKELSRNNFSFWHTASKKNSINRSLAFRACKYTTAQ